jgi:hypothetical protein
MNMTSASIEIADALMRLVRMRKMLFLLILCVTGLQFSSASAQTSAQNADWTVMVFMNAKNNLECFALLNFAQIAAVGSTDKVNVLVDFGRPRSHMACPNPPPKWSGILRFRVKAGMKPTEPNAIRGFKRTAGPQADMGNRQTLSKFIHWSMQHYPAQHYMLVVWNHGQGWRLQLRNSRSAGAKVVAGLGTGWRPPIRGGVRSVSFDDDSGHHLFNSDISTALRENISMPIDIIGFDACLMAMLETGYQMKDLAHHLIGSEELEPGTGWNYTTLLESLTRPTRRPIQS